MNNAQQRASQSRNAVLLILVFSVLFLNGCEDPGVIGGGFTDTNTSITVDTLSVDQLEPLNFNHFSGRLTHFSAGSFSDPVFGDMTATGLIKPALSASDNDTMEAEADMKLRLQFDQENVYGDSIATAEFDLVEMAQVWRGRAWRLEDQPVLSDAASVGSFTLGEQDSIDVSLSDEWVQKYRSFFESETANSDSLYRLQFPGLAVVPRNTSKVIPVVADSSRFIIENPNEDTLQVAPLDWAYGLQREGQEIPSGVYGFHSTMEQIFNFNLELSQEDLGTINISRVELVLYENHDLLAGSMDEVSPGAARPDILFANLHLVESDQVPDALDPGSPLLLGFYNESDHSYRFNLTNFVNGVLLEGVPRELKFYLTLQSNNGIIRSTLIHNQQAPSDKHPKLIVTSVQNEEGSN